MVVFGAAILLAGFDQPLVLVTISTVLGGVIMTIYSILLVITNRRYLPEGAAAARLPARDHRRGDHPARRVLDDRGHQPVREPVLNRSIATVCLSGTLEEKLAAAAAAGFDAVEVFEPDLIAAPHAPPEIRRRAEALGLEIALYQPLRDFEAMPPERFAANLRAGGGASSA